MPVKALISDHQPIEQFDINPLPYQRRILGTGSHWPEGEAVHNPDSVAINGAKADYKLSALRLRAGVVRTVMP